MNKKIGIIGGGAAGLMAAYAAAKEGASVTVFERNNRPARKVMITGKGRCNVTNNCDRDTFLLNVAHGSRFMYSAFSAFSCEDTMRFFESKGVPLKTERGNRVFPVSDKAVDIVDALSNVTKLNNVTIINSRVAHITWEDGIATGLITQDGTEYFFDSIILATGGKSYPVTGSTGDGYIMAEKLGHKITGLRPSLVPLVCHQGFCSYLCGLSLKNVSLSIYEEGKKKPIYTELGEMMFTDFGITGPLVLSASAHIEKIDEKKYTAIIDLKPALTREMLDKRILRDFHDESNKDFGNSLDKLLPQRLVSVIVKNSGIDPKKKVNNITREERENLVNALKNLKLDITGFRPIEEAVVTSGGIDLKEISPSTMESKLVKGLYFAGEIMNIDAYTGGFNLQIAFSTGYLAGKSAAL